MPEGEALGYLHWRRTPAWVFTIHKRLSPRSSGVTWRLPEAALICWSTSPGGAPGGVRRLFGRYPYNQRRQRSEAGPRTRDGHEVSRKTTARIHPLRIGRWHPLSPPGRCRRWWRRRGTSSRRGQNGLPPGVDARSPANQSSRGKPVLQLSATLCAPPPYAGKRIANRVDSLRWMCSPVWQRQSEMNKSVR